MSEQVDGIAFAPAGPLRHRGNSLANARIEREPMGQVLEALNARALMVGHTVTRTGRISRRFNGRLYRGDVGMGYGRPGRAPWKGPDFRQFVDHWIGLTRRVGTIQRLYDRWVLGRRDRARESRWSITRNVLGWVN